MKRRATGNTLGLVAAALVVLVLLGIFAFGVFILLGGGRQTESAADAGNLNVARVAILAPSIQLNPKDPTATSASINGSTVTYGDIDNTIQQVVLNGNSTVNLLNFNKIVAWAMVSAINAQADGDSNAIALAHAIWQRVEGDTTNSLGAQLKGALTNSPSQTTLTSSMIGNSTDVPTGNWPAVVFNKVALSNTTQLANNDSGQQITWQSCDYGYLGAGDSTNVPGTVVQDPNNLPVSLATNTPYSITLPLTSDGYIQGYVPIKVGNDTYYYVTVYHDQNPGLRSNSEFQSNQTQPGAGTVALPPNTFYNHATLLIKKTNSTMAVGSPACIGTKQYGSVTPLPTYFVFDNTPSGTYHGVVPGTCNDVTCDELGQGIFVLSDKNGAKIFSTDSSVINSIQNWFDGGQKGKAPSTQDSSGNSVVFDYSSGSAVTDVSSLSWNGPSSMVTCTDQNSDINNPNADSQCTQDVSNGVFNKAYHSGSSGSNVVSISGLTAAEVVKDGVASLWAQYRSTGNGCITLNPSVESGLALYEADANPISNPSMNIPWGTAKNGKPQQEGQIYCCPGADWVDANRIGKVTVQLDPKSVIDQTTINGLPYQMDVTTSGSTNTTTVSADPGAAKRPSSVYKAYFTQRAKAMGASQSDIDAVWATKIDVGEVWYAFMQNGKLIASKTPPNSWPALSKPGSGLGGSVLRAYKLYNVFWNVVNAQNDFNIHDRFFTQVGNNGAVDAEDSCYLEVGTGGFGGCLGRISFHEKVGNGPGPAPQVVLNGLTDPLGGSPESQIGGSGTATGETGGANISGAPCMIEPN